MVIIFLSITSLFPLLSISCQEMNEFVVVAAVELLTSSWDSWKVSLLSFKVEGKFLTGYFCFGKCFIIIIIMIIIFFFGRWCRCTSCSWYPLGLSNSSWGLFICKNVIRIEGNEINYELWIIVCCGLQELELLSLEARPLSVSRHLWTCELLMIVILLARCNHRSCFIITTGLFTGITGSADQSTTNGSFRTSNIEFAPSLLTNLLMNDNLYR